MLKDWESCYAILWRPKKKQGVTLGGRGVRRLTQVKFTSSKNTTPRPSEVNQQWEKWKSAVMATFQHCTSTDDEPQHAQCPAGLDSWCFYQRTLARGDTPLSHTENVSSYLGNGVAEHVKEVYTRLSDEELLPRCLGRKTQNANESLHSMLWNRCPKYIFVNRNPQETVQSRLSRNSQVY